MLLIQGEGSVELGKECKYGKGNVLELVPSNFIHLDDVCNSTT